MDAIKENDILRDYMAWVYGLLYYAEGAKFPSRTIVWLEELLGAVRVDCHACHSELKIVQEKEPKVRGFTSMSAHTDWQSWRMREKKGFAGKDKSPFSPPRTSGESESAHDLDFEDQPSSTSPVVDNQSNSPPPPVPASPHLAASDLQTKRHPANNQSGNAVVLGSWAIS